MMRNVCSIFAGIILSWSLLTPTTQAQITTGTVTGRIVDSSGSVLPRAQVVLISEAHGTRSAAILTNDSGDYLFADVTGDTYTLEVTAPSFKSARRTGIVVAS